MAEEDAKFVGTVPAAYDECLGPVIFAPYADDLATRVQSRIRRGRVLEVACGTGFLTRRLDARLPPAIRITATDLNDAMLALAKAKMPASERLEWHVADAAVLPLASATFEAVVCQFGLMFVPDKVAALREVRRVLKEDGELLFNVWCRIEDNAFARIAHEVVAGFFDAGPPTFYQVPFSYHDEAVIRADLSHAGFVDVSCEHLELGLVAPSVRQFARGLVEGNPIVHAIREAGVPIPSVIDAVSEALVREGGGSPFRSKANALVWCARAA